MKKDDEHGITRDFDHLVQPSQIFDRPADVVNDPDLSLNEKRAILASWASDACAVEAAPALRRAPGRRRPVSVDDILEALRSLGKAAREGEDAHTWGRKLRRMAIFTWRSPDHPAQGLPN